MKKSFMTRVLATGLSLAMAFSLSAATNVTTAAAATSPMESTKITVTEGKTSSWVYLKNRGNSKYRIKSYKRTETAKKFITAKVGTKKRAVKVTAKKDAVTNAGLKQKQVAMTINLVKKADANKKNAKVVKTAKLYVVVKAKAVKKITMTAAATAVKEITLTFSGAVKDTTAAKITVKKGNTTPTFTTTWAADAKSAVLAMDSKLTKGTYEVTVSGVETEDLVATIDVEDQKLTAFELISTNLVADPDAATKGSIYFRAVDQYGKNVSGITPTVTTSFGGEANPASATKAAENTKIVVEKMSTALAIIGTKGTITIVDNKTGVNLTSEITYVAPAKASKVEVVSVYNTNTGKKVETMTAGDKAGNLKIALKFTDQYNTEMAPKDVKDLEISLAAGTTNVDIANKADTVTIDDKTYYALALDNTLKAGTFQITVVNTKVGLLDNLSFDVAPGTVIKSFSVSADNDIYANEKATLSYVAVDADGKEVTSYDVIEKALKGGLPKGVSVEKQKDGSAKLTYVYSDSSTGTKKTEVDHPDADTKRGSDNTTLTFQVYPNTTNILVVNTSIRVNQKRVFWEVTGVNSDKAVAGVENTHLDFKAEDFKISDQYGNTLSKDEINDLIGATNAVSAAAIENKSNWTVTPVKLAAKATTFGAIVSKSGIVKIKVFAEANPKGYDNGYELTLSQEKAEKASSFEIKWNDGVSTFCTSKAGITASVIKNKFTVVGKVGGKTVTIPSDNYEVTGLTGNDCLKDPTADKVDKKTIEGTVTVTVSTTDDNDKYVATEITAKFTNSNEAPTLASIKADNDKKIATGTGIKTTVADLAKGFKLKDQYGNAIDSTGVAATVVVLDSATADVKYNGSTKCVVENAKLGDKLSITLTKGDLTANREVTLEV